MSRALKAALAAAVLSIVAGCATPAADAPAPPSLAGLDPARGPAPALRNAIAVGALTVGQDTAQPWRSTVGPAEIQQTLTQTLAAAGLGAPQGGRYRLDGVLLTLQRPYAGFAMTVTAQIAWRLTEVATGAVVYGATLTTPGTATLENAITNETRLRIADERAVQANLRRLVEELYALPEPRPVPPRR